MIREFSPTELKQHLEVAIPPPLLLDVREPWEFQRVHLPESRLVPMREIPGALDELDQEREIIVICHHGIRSRQVAYFLEAQGFLHIINLSSGIDGWAREIDMSMPVY